MPAASARLGAEAARTAVKCSTFLPRWVHTSQADAVDAEVKLLSRCREPLELADTKVGEGDEDYIHSISGGSETGPNLVCMSGYGSGAGCYFRNIDALCSRVRTFAVDWLGTGLSGRPPFLAKSREEAENFFLDSFETWREKTGLDKFILMGHSLGGYLAANYALKHPERVQHLILVCPAAMAKKPEDNELPHWAKSPWTWQGQLWRIMTFLWNAGATPQMVIRGLGPMGRNLVEGYVRRRFQGMELSEEEAAALFSYFYHITVAPGCGEHALRHVMAPFAWARNPMQDRLTDLKVPVTFIYGDFDWMSPTAAETICDQISRKSGPPKNDADRQIYTIPYAGHFVFMEQPDLFQAAVMRVCQHYT